MKKAANRALAIVLSLTLVLSCAGVAFAGNNLQTTFEEVKVQKEQTPAAKTAGTEAAVIKAVENAADSKAYEGEFSLTQINTGDEKVTAATVAFDQNEIIGQHPDYSSMNIVGHSTPVTISSKGTVLMAAAAGVSNGKSVSFGLFEDANMTKPVGTSYPYSVSAGKIAPSNGSTYAIKVTKAGTYYLGAYCTNSINYPQSFTNVIGVAAAFVKGTDRTLTSSKWAAVGQKDAQKNYFKYVPKYTGYIKVYLQNLSSGKVTLLNSKRYIRSESLSTYGTDPKVFGVKKGTAYYIKVDAGSNSKGAYRIKVSNYSVSDTSGYTKSRAATLYDNKLKKGVIVADSATSDWYKFKLTSKKTKSFLITMNGGLSSGGMKIVMYDTKGKARTLGTYRGTPIKFGLKIVGTGYLPTGTYYIKIYREDKLSSGWYSLYR